MINYPLRIGGLLCGLMLLWAIFGPSLAPKDPLETRRAFVIDGVTYGAPPMRVLPPFTTPDHPLGMDRISRDLLSRLLWAVRPTLLLCGIGALLRVVLGVIMGVVLGLSSRRLQHWLDWLVILSGAVPILLTAIAVLLFNPQPGLAAFVVALTLTGWISTAVLVRNHIQTVSQAAFIESAYALGLSRRQIVWRHIMPHLRPLLPVLLASELSAVTLLVAELGYLGLYIGGDFVYSDFVGDGPVPDYIIKTLGAPELGQMLSDFFGQLNRTPWEPVFAGITLALLLGGFSLLSEGLRRRANLYQARSGKA